MLLATQFKLILNSVNLKFIQPKVVSLTDDVSGVATGNITYTVTFDEAVNLFSSSSVQVTNGTVASASAVGDTGKNTGGMGAYSPSKLINDNLEKKIISMKKHKKAQQSIKKAQQSTKKHEKA